MLPCQKGIRGHKQPLLFPPFKAAALQRLFEETLITRLLITSMHWHCVQHTGLNNNKISHLGLIQSEKQNIVLRKRFAWMHECWFLHLILNQLEHLLDCSVTRTQTTLRYCENWAVPTFMSYSFPDWQMTGYLYEKRNLWKRDCKGTKVKEHFFFKKRKKSQISRLALSKFVFIQS